MRERRPSTASKPTANTKRTRRDPAADVLRILKDDSVSIRRRYMMAKSCLKQRAHRKEAINVLHLVVGSKNIGDKARDLATRLLLKHDPPRRRSLTILPKSWKGLIGIAEGKVRWVSDEEFMRIPKREKFPDYVEQEDQQ